MTPDQLISGYSELERRIREIETRLNEVLANKPSLDKLASLEQVRAQWQASIPRLLDKLRDLEKIQSLEARIQALEAAASNSSNDPRRSS
ncbi:MAG: hypothetical protein JOY95_02405 [Silvibacterium sp.]|nr:hypothetical protein [Silvibacterium sp.]